MNRNKGRELAKRTHAAALARGDSRAERAEGARALRMELHRPLMEADERGKVRPVVGEDGRQMRPVDIIANGIVSEAMKGSLLHAKFAFETAYGKPTQSVEVDERENMTLVDLVEGDDWEET